MDTARDLADRLASLLRREQGALADFLLALADFDRRRLWEPLGYSSLFYFLHRALQLSAGAAYHRKTAAGLLQRFPEVIAPLRDGRLCLSSVVELSKVMTPANAADVLPRFFHASKQEAKAVAAAIAPLDVIPQRVVVTPVAAPTPPPLPVREAAPAALELGQAFHPGETPPAASRAAVPQLAPATALRSSAEPLTADLRRLHLTVSKRFMEKLETAKDALSHSHAGAELEAILEAGLDLVIERAAKRKGLVKRPRTNASAAAAASDDGEGGKSRRIPAAVRREVWERDGGRCQWPTADGGVCGSTCRVQFDHIVPVARGGRSISANLRLACAFHNDLAARQVYGGPFMDRFTRAAGVSDRQPADPR